MNIDEQLNKFLSLEEVDKFLPALEEIPTGSNAGEEEWEQKLCSLLGINWGERSPEQESRRLAALELIAYSRGWARSHRLGILAGAERMKASAARKAAEEALAAAEAAEAEAAKIEATREEIFASMPELQQRRGKTGLYYS